VRESRLAAQRRASKCNERSSLWRGASLLRTAEASCGYEGAPRVVKRIHVSSKRASSSHEQARCGSDFAWRVKTTFRAHKRAPGCGAKSRRCARSLFDVQRIELAARRAASMCSASRSAHAEALRCAAHGGRRTRRRHAVHANSNGGAGRKLAVREAASLGGGGRNGGTDPASRVRQRARSTRRRLVDTRN
jgi:hypothetical protein